MIPSPVGRVRPPADLCDPKRRLPVVVLSHHPAELLERVLDLVDLGGVRVQGRGVEAALHVPDVVEAVEEVPGLRIRVGEHAAEHDPGIRIPALDRDFGDPQQLGVLACRWVRRKELLQVGLVPDLPGMDRQRRGVRSELLAVAVRPVAAARSVTRHGRLEEGLPCPSVGGAPERGSGWGAGHPARAPPQERHGPDSIPGKAADQPVAHAPGDGSPARLKHRPVEQQALCPYLGGAQSLEVPAIELLFMVHAEELRPGRRSRGGGQQRHRKHGDEDPAAPHRREASSAPGRQRASGRRLADISECARASWTLRWGRVKG